MIHGWGWVGPPDRVLLKKLGANCSIPWTQSSYLSQANFSLGLAWRHSQAAVPLKQTSEQVTAWAGHGYGDPLATQAMPEGHFALVQWQTALQQLTLTVDPFGSWPWFYTQVGERFYFATEFKLLRQIPGLSLALNFEALHQYLVFSFLPGKDTPLKQVHRLMGGQTLRWQDGHLNLHTQPPGQTAVQSPPKSLDENRLAFSHAVERAVAERITPAQIPALYLSGGLDSSAVGVWLRQSGLHPVALSLDFGKFDTELPLATQVAQHLAVPLVAIRVKPPSRHDLRQLAWDLDLPYGDPVTWPQLCLARHARKRGFTDVFNGEGGDQLFGGWSNKPLIAAQVYAPAQNPIEQYLHAYHRFYRHEQQFFSRDFLAELSGSQPHPFLEPFLGDGSRQPFLHQLRMVDLYLKGCCNILPRALHIANSQGLAVHMPLFDRQLSQWALSLAPELKLQGAEEKYLLKWLLQSALPDNILYRRKAGMNAPANAWMTSWRGKSISRALFNRHAVTQRGLFRYEALKGLLKGENHPAETRKRRIGEKWWTLVMLATWLEVFVDGNGQRPG